jgi:hypothetical protein
MQLEWPSLEEFTEKLFPLNIARTAYFPHGEDFENFSFVYSPSKVTRVEPRDEQNFRFRFEGVFEGTLEGPPRFIQGTNLVKGWYAEYAQNRIIITSRQLKAQKTSDGKPILATMVVEYNEYPISLLLIVE